ncbi:glycosyltransferase [Microcella daejeonensis]|uniref:D-inositol 3-phosphate glycosyltransferase n=1 Tax=Microcella daejeonensis TaxID=2994971 RepID=A0A9E8MKA1_9MICO|nr:glycosyltransferase [Microcella daejeonensis]WAB81093.1 glycosyltransferase [Microcella daejeonensis]
MTDAPHQPGSTARPLRILIGGDTFGPDVNGAAKFAERLAGGLVERGHEVHVVAPRPEDGPNVTRIEEHEGQRMTVHRLRSWRWHPHPWLRYALPWRIEQNAARILDEVRPDVVHFQSHIVIGRGLARQAAKRGIRVIGTNHFMPDNAMQFTPFIGGLKDRAISAMWKAAGRTFGLAAEVTTPTRRAADYLEKYTELRGVHAISCGLHIDNYTPAMEPRDENVVLFLGRVEAEKHIDEMLRAVARLDASLAVQVEIIGDGEQRPALERLARELGIADRVHFAGYAPEDYLMRQLTRATVFAMPSIAELQSIATMEAMASGLPVVGANAMALPHLIHDGENGFLFEPGDIDGFAERLNRIFTMSHEELLVLKRESLAIVEAHDINRTLDTFEALYRGEPVDDPVADGVGSTTH